MHVLMRLPFRVGRGVLFIRGLMVCGVNIDIPGGTTFSGVARYVCRLVLCSASEWRTLEGGY